MHPFDKSRCSFHIPDFKTEEQEHAFFRSLTPQQNLEILNLMNRWKYGDEAFDAPMDKTYFRVVRLSDEDDL